MKKEYILIGAAALLGAYVLMPKGEEAGPGGSGGLGAGLGGLPGIPGSGGGGADTPTVNIDFPALPPFVAPEPGETKKEAATDPTTPYNVMGDYSRDSSWKQNIGVPPSPDYSTYTAPSWKDTSNPNMTGSDILNMVKNSDTKKEKALTAEEQFPWLFGKTAQKTSIGSLAERTTKGSIYSVRGEGTQTSGKGGEITRTAVTKKEQAKIDYASRGYGYAGSSGGISIYGSSIPGGLSSTLSSAMAAQGVTSVRY